MRPVYDSDELIDTPPSYVPVETKSNGDLVSKAAEFAAQIIDDPIYLMKLQERARQGALPPKIETMLWAYRFGKPVDASKFKQGPSEQQLLAEMSLEALTELANANAAEAQLLLNAKMKRLNIAPIRGGVQ